MQWLINIIKKWVEAQGYATEAWVQAQGYALQSWVEAQAYLTTGFFDRGDPADEDFNLGELTADGNWHLMTLGHICDPYSKVVLLSVIYMGDAVDLETFFRTNENTNAYNVSILRTQTANVVFCCDIVVPMDSLRKIQYKITAFGVTLLNITVKGWWL